MAFTNLDLALGKPCCGCIFSSPPHTYNLVSLKVRYVCANFFRVFSCWIWENIWFLEKVITTKNSLNIHPWNHVCLVYNFLSLVKFLNCGFKAHLPFPLIDQLYLFFVISRLYQISIFFLIFWYNDLNYFNKNSFFCYKFNS